MTAAHTDKGAETIREMRALANYLESHPTIADQWYTPEGFAMAHNEQDWQSMLSELGTFDKSSDDMTLGAVQTTDDGLRIRLCILHEHVCTRVKTGSQLVKRLEYPASVTPTVVTEEVDVYEWVCPPEWKDRTNGGEES